MRFLLFETTGNSLLCDKILPPALVKIFLLTFAILMALIGQGRAEIQAGRKEIPILRKICAIKLCL